MIEKIIKRLTSSPWVYDFVQFILEGNYSQEIVRAVAAGPDDKLLDIGCGTGYFSQFFNSDYTGVDIDAVYIAQARKKFTNNHRRFLMAGAGKIDFPDKSFDKVLLINVIHHLSDGDLAIVLAEAARLAKKEILIFDMATEKVSWLTSWLLEMDNGKFIRPLERQAALVGRVLKIERSFIFKTPRNLLAHSAITCNP